MILGVCIYLPGGCLVIYLRPQKAVCWEREGSGEVISGLDGGL